MYNFEYSLRNLGVSVFDDQYICNIVIGFQICDEKKKFVLGKWVAVKIVCVRTYDGQNIGHARAQVTDRTVIMLPWDRFDRQK